MFIMFIIILIIRLIIIIKIKKKQQLFVIYVDWDYNMTVWIVAWNDIMTAGLIRLHMPGVK